MKKKFKKCIIKQYKPDVGEIISAIVLSPFVSMYGIVISLIPIVNAVILLGGTNSFKDSLYDLFLTEKETEIEVYCKKK